MTVISTGFNIFQTNFSKLRSPLNTKDLEELPHSREANRSTCSMTLLRRTSRCLGNIFKQFLFEHHSWLTRTSGCSTNRLENKESWEFYITASLYDDSQGGQWDRTANKMIRRLNETEYWSRKEAGTLVSNSSFCESTQCLRDRHRLVS